MDKRRKIFKAFTAERLKPFRKSKALSQEKMSERLRLTPRAYSDLEAGRACFSARSLIFLLLSMSKEEVWNLLLEIRQLVDENEL